MCWCAFMLQVCIIEPSLCLLPSVTGVVYYFPRRQLILSFDRCVIYHSKGIWEYIPKSIPSVCLSICTAIFKRIAGLCFYLKCLMDSSWQALQTNRKFFFQISSLSVCTTIFKRIAWLCFYLKYLMLYINGFVTTSSTKLMESIFFLI